MQSFYYLKPGQTLRNTKVSERSMGLMIDKQVYNRFKEYGTEKERAAILAQQEVKRIADRKKASHEMTKNWDNTIENIQKRLKEKLLSKRKRAEEARIKFFKELTVQKLAEREEVVKEARKLLLHRKTNCLELKKAHRASECYRIRDLQMIEKKEIQEKEKEIKEKWDKFALEDSRKFQEEQKHILDNISKKERAYKKEIMDQIIINEETRNQQNMEEKKKDIEDLKNMADELLQLKENDIKEAIKKKAELNKLFVGAIEEKKRHQLKQQQDDEYQKLIFEAYLRMKQRVLKQMKAARLKAQDDKQKRAEVIGKKFSEKVTSQAAEEEELLNKIEAEKLAAELQQIKEKRDQKVKLALETKKANLEIEKEQEKLRKKEKELQEWETIQRYKRDEFNKQWNAKAADNEKQRKLDYAATLKKQMEENDMKRQEEQQEITDYEIATVKMIQNTNEKVLEYGNEILKEVEGVGPTYPIIKAIEHFKQKAGLLPKVKPESTEPKRVRKKCGRRRYCSKPIPEEQIFCFG